MAEPAYTGRVAGRVFHKRRTWVALGVTGLAAVAAICAAPTLLERRVSQSPFRKAFEPAKSLLPSSAVFPPIAVIDSGLDLKLADQEGRVLPWEEARRLSLAPDGDVTGMWDDLSHGTALFLELGAQANGFGMIGLIPEAPLFPIRLGTREELLSAKVPLRRLLDALELAKAKGARLISLSLSNVTSIWNKEAVSKALVGFEQDFLLIAAAGNDGLSLEYGDTCAYVPVCLSNPNLIKVGASDYHLSNHGKVIDLSLPSESTQWKFSRGNPAAGFALLKGFSSSAAAPKAVALAALVLAARPHWSPKEVKTFLLSVRGAKDDIDPRLLMRALSSPRDTKASR